MLGLPLVVAMVSFFPARPAHAPVAIARGVLTSYGAGQAEGHVTIRDAKGVRQDFFLGYPMRVNGARLVCAFAGQCPQWPATLVVGKSRVAVSYWVARHRDKAVRVADALTDGR